MDYTSDDKEFRNLFRATDKNSDGFIQPEELRYVEVLARALAANFLPNKSKQYFIYPGWFLQLSGIGLHSYIFRNV